MMNIIKELNNELNAFIAQDKSLLSITICLIIVITILTIVLLIIRCLYRIYTKKNKYEFLISILTIFTFFIMRFYINSYLTRIGLDISIIYIINAIIVGIFAVISSKLNKGCKGESMKFNKKDILIFIIVATMFYYYITFFFFVFKEVLGTFLHASAILAYALKMDIINLPKGVNKLCYIIYEFINNNFGNNNKITIGSDIDNSKTKPLNLKPRNPTIILMEGSEPNQGTNSVSNTQYGSEDVGTSTSNTNTNLQNNNSQDNFFTRYFYRRGSVFYNLFNGDRVLPRKGILLNKSDYYLDQVSSNDLEESVNTSRGYVNNIDNPEFLNSPYNKNYYPLEWNNPYSNKGILELVQLHKTNLNDLQRINRKFTRFVNSLSPEEKELEQAVIDWTIDIRQKIIRLVDTGNVSLKNMDICLKMTKEFYSIKSDIIFQVKYGEEAELIKEQLKYMSDDLHGLNFIELRRRNHPMAPDIAINTRARTKRCIEDAAEKIGQRVSTPPGNLGAVWHTRLKIETLHSWMNLKEIEENKAQIEANLKAMKKAKEDREGNIFELVDLGDSDSE